MTISIRGRFIEAIDLDRSEFACGGDVQSKPKQVQVLSIFATTSDVLSGVPYTDAPNAELWDASGEMAPENSARVAP